MEMYFQNLLHNHEKTPKSAKLSSFHILDVFLIMRDKCKEENALKGAEGNALGGQKLKVK